VTSVTSRIAVRGRLRREQPHAPRLRIPHPDPKDDDLDHQLSGLVAVVTGASKGIGLATTRTLLGEGARVVAVSRSAGDDLDDLACPASCTRPPT
jgi:3-oxoacyl-ACP reductase-like protein